MSPDALGFDGPLRVAYVQHQIEQGAYHLRGEPRCGPFAIAGDFTECLPGILQAGDVFYTDPQIEPRPSDLVRVRWSARVHALLSDQHSTKNVSHTAVKLLAPGAGPLADPERDIPACYGRGPEDWPGWVLCTRMGVFLLSDNELEGVVSRVERCGESLYE